LVAKQFDKMSLSLEMVLLGQDVQQMQDPDIADSDFRDGGGDAKEVTYAAPSIQGQQADAIGNYDYGLANYDGGAGDDVFNLTRFDDMLFSDLLSGLEDMSNNSSSSSSNVSLHPDLVDLLKELDTELKDGRKDDR
jgi:hypothetical protein